VTFQLPLGLIEKARDVVFLSPGPTWRASWKRERAEKKRGEPFPSRAGAILKTGRPVKAA
jgi:hypothetical protein